MYDKALAYSETSIQQPFLSINYITWFVIDEMYGKINPIKKKTAQTVSTRLSSIKEGAGTRPAAATCLSQATLKFSQIGMHILVAVGKHCCGETLL